MYSSKQVKIRKPHQCFSCFRVFIKGTELIKWACIFDSDFCSGYTCLTCDAIMKKQPLEPGRDDGYAEGWVNEQLNKGQTPENFLSTLI